MLGQPRSHLAGVALQGRHHAGHPINGIVSQVWLRAVRRAAVRVTAPADDSLVGYDHLQRGRLGDDGPIRLPWKDRASARPEFRQRRGARVAVLFIDGRGHHDRRHSAGALGDQAGKSAEHRRQSPFDVAGSAPVNPAVAHHRGPRLDRHTFDRHRILMRFEQDQPASLVAGYRAIEAGHDVIALGFDRLSLVWHAELLEQRLEIVGDVVLEVFGPRHRLAHRIDARQRDQLTQCSCQIQRHGSKYGLEG